MEIKRTRVDTSFEKMMAVGMITSDKALSEILSIVTLDIFNSSSRARWIYRTCENFHKKYGKAPGKHIEDIFNEEVREGKIDDVTARLIEQVLTGLSDQYERQDFNEDYLLDKVEKWARKRSLELLTKDIQTKLLQEDVDGAEEKLSKYNVVRKDVTSSTCHLNPITAGELICKGTEVVEWIWDLIIPAGSLVGLSGFMKEGKTELYNQLVEKLNRGVPFLRFECKKINILILDLENPMALKRKWIINAGLDKEEGLFFHMGELPYTAATLNELKAFIVAHDIKLVVIDTVVLFWNLENENDNSETQRAGRLLLNMTRETGCTILAVCHESKAGGEGGRSVRGASSLFGLFDQLLILNRRHGGTETQRVLKIKGRYSESPKELILDFRNGQYICLGKAEDVEKKSIRRKVQEVLKSYGTMTVEMILEALKNDGIKSAGVRTVLNELEAEEVIIKEGTGVKGNPYMYRMSDV